MIRSGETWTRQDREHLPLSRVEPTMHILAGLERQSALLGHRDRFTIARVAPRARVTLLRREHPKAAQLHPIPSRQSGRDRAQDRIDDDLNVPLVQVRVLLREPFDQFGFEHRSLTPKRSAPEGAVIAVMTRWPATGGWGIRPASPDAPALFQHDCFGPCTCHVGLSSAAAEWPTFLVRWLGQR